MVGSLLIGNKHFLVRELVQAGRSTSCLGLTNGKMVLSLPFSTMAAFTVSNPVKR